MKNAKYTKWEDFVKSNESILQAKPFNFYIEKGILNFCVESEGMRYFCTGSECYVSDIYFDANIKLKDQCEFDNFWMVEVDNQKNVLCNW